MVISLTTYIGQGVGPGPEKRFEFLKKSLETFFASDFPDNTVVHLLDDCSQSQEAVDYIMGLKAPEHVDLHIHRHEQNMGCDPTMVENIRRCFNERGDEFVLTADSDVIYHPGWIFKLLAALSELLLMDKKIGMLSCFDTNNHPFKKTINNHIIEKHSLGGFCALLNRHLFLEKGLQTETWDWKFVDLCRDNGYGMYCTEPSWVQHMGCGKSAFGKSYDIAHNFVGEQVEQENINSCA